MAARRPRLTERRPPRVQAGYTLVEVVVAMLITAVIVTSVFSAAVTAKSGTGKNDRRLLASQAARNLSATLKLYVTGCSCDFTTGVCDAASCADIPGPNPGNAANAFSLTDDTKTPPIHDSCDSSCSGGANCYALKLGAHCVTGLLPGWFEAAPYNARVRYTVTQSGVVEGRVVPQVTLDVQWQE